MFLRRTIVRSPNSISKLGIRVLYQKVDVRVILCNVREINSNTVRNGIIRIY